MWEWRGIGGGVPGNGRAYEQTGGDSTFWSAAHVWLGCHTTQCKPGHLPTPWQAGRLWAVVAAPCKPCIMIKTNPPAAYHFIHKAAAASQLKGPKPWAPPLRSILADYTRPGVAYLQITGIAEWVNDVFLLTLCVILITSKHTSCPTPLPATSCTGTLTTRYLSTKKVQADLSMWQPLKTVCVRYVHSLTLLLISDHRVFKASQICS